MRFRFLAVAVLAIACSWVFGCNLITGVGNLTFTDEPAEGGSGSGSSSGGSGGGIVPAGSHSVTSSTLQLRGMTTDGFVAYGDTSTSTLWALGVEQPDGGAPASSAPLALGAADISTAYVLGKLVLFFAPSGESDAGPSRVGALQVWSSSIGQVSSVASSAVEPLTYFTFAASADGRYLAYLGNVASDGATASLFLLDVTTTVQKELITSIDVVADNCQPTLAFSGEYLAASYCQVSPGGSVSGTSRLIATVSTFSTSGQQATLATNVDPQFGVDPNGVAAIMLSAGGIVASPVTGVGGLVTIDPTGASAVISSDGTAVVYATTAYALKRASTTAPVNPIALAPTSFAAVSALSGDGNWALGALTAGSQDGTSDLYVASATTAGAAVTLSSATTAATDLGDPFTADSKYAVFLSGVTPSLTGALMVYELGTGSAPSTLGSGAFEDVAVGGSQLVFNLNDTNGKADLDWVNLAWGLTPTLITPQADEAFFVGPANDKVVYTYSNGSSSTNGLWIAPMPGTPGTHVTCANAGSVHPPSGASGSCTSDDVSFYDTDCISSGTASLDLCSDVESVVGTPCFNCLDTQLGSAQWGVLIENPAGGGIIQINPGGCFAMQGDSVCGSAMQSQLECENTACASQTTLDGFNTCQTAADLATCACNVANVTAACAALATSTCFPANYTTFESKFLAYAQVMCE